LFLYKSKPLIKSAKGPKSPKSVGLSGCGGWSIFLSSDGDCPIIEGRRL